MAANTVRQMRSAFRAALRRRREVRQALAQTLRRALRDHRAALIASMKPAAAAAAAPTADLDTRVLTVIGRHPDGVRALDLGNELGVDWRRVLEATRNLVAAGAVEQVDQHFYLAAKAGPQW